MLFTEQDLDNLSKLARITVNKEEKSKMVLDIQSILGYISEINKVQGQLVHEEEALFNVVREDIVTHEPGSNRDALLQESPSVKDGYVKVEQVLK